jgi:hypothetical protein
VAQRALSLKQPWAALLVQGLKTIEVRRWTTPYRGPLLIHAARVSDSRPEAWKRVPPDLCEATQLRGGIVGVGVLEDVREYRSLDVFSLDEARHLNELSWFEPAGLFGFCFGEVRAVPFVKVPGNVRLFGVDLEVALPAGVGPARPFGCPAGLSSGAAGQPEGRAAPTQAVPASPLAAIARRKKRLLRSLAHRAPAE